MPLATDDILQSNTGSFEGTSGSVTLLSATTAGSPVLIFVGMGGDNATSLAVSTPAGFEECALHNSGLAYGRPYMFLMRASAGGETTWTVNVTGGSAQICWAVVEWPGFDTADGVYLGENSSKPVGVGTPVASLATDTVSGSASYDAMAISMHIATNLSSAPTVTGHSANWQEIANVSRDNGTRWHTLSVAALPMFDLVSVSDTATVSPDSYLYNAISVFTAVNAKHAARFLSVAGMEWGTATSMTNGSAAIGHGTAPFDAVVGSPAVVTSTPRTGSYALELSAAAAAECVTWTTRSGGFVGNLGVAGNPNPALLVERFHFYFPTSLPGADVEIASVEAGSLANGVVIWYRSASQKIGVKIGTGTEVLSDAVVAADVWIGLDYRYDPRTTTHTFDWQVDYDATPGDATGPVAQTQASTSGMTAAVVSTARKGWTTSKTATIRYDDMAAAQDRHAYPIGDINIRPLKVDQAGTPTISGTTTNFNTYTSNGSMAAWNATTARALVDDIPPTIGASSDGIAQVTTATADFVRIPMETYSAAPDHVIRGGRWYFAPWANSGTAATLGWGWADGTDYSGSNASDHGQDNAALIWLSKMHHNPAQSNSYYPLTQTKVDALEALVGWSSDASPDVGLHAVLFELVTQPAATIGIIEIEDAAFSVYVRQDADSGAVASYLATTPSGTRGATLTWTIDGTPGSQYVAPNTVYEKSVGAASIATVTSVGLEPDPG